MMFNTQYQEIKPKEKKPKLLIASIILNIFLVGCLVGGAYHLFWSDNPTLNKYHGKNQTGLRFVAENLSDEQQARFRDSIHQTRHDARPIIMQGIEARRHLRELLNAPTFDRAAISTEIAKVRESDNALRIKMEENLINFAETLTPEERTKLAEGLTKKGPLRERIVPLN